MEIVVKDGKHLIIEMYFDIFYDISLQFLQDKIIAAIKITIDRPANMNLGHKMLDTQFAI